MRRGNSLGHEYVDTIYFNPYSGEYISTWRYGVNQSLGDWIIWSQVPCISDLLGPGRQSNLGCRRAGHPAPGGNGPSDVLESRCCAASGRRLREKHKPRRLLPRPASHNLIHFCARFMLGLLEHTMAKTNSANRDIATSIHPYTNLKTHETEGPLVITEGDGVFVRDENGKTYLEGLSGLWCVSLGFSERRLAEAAYRQMLKLPFYHTFAHKAHRYRHRTG